MGDGVVNEVRWRQFAALPKTPIWNTGSTKRMKPLIERKATGESGRQLQNHQSEQVGIGQDIHETGKEQELLFQSQSI